MGSVNITFAICNVTVLHHSVIVDITTTFHTQGCRHISNVTYTNCKLVIAVKTDNIICRVQLRFICIMYLLFFSCHHETKC